MIISTTARQSKNRVVTHLTKTERKIVKTGVPVYFKSNKLSGGTYGTYWRKAIANGAFINAHVPTEAELALLGA